MGSGICWEKLGHNHGLFTRSWLHFLFECSKAVFVLLFLLCFQSVTTTGATLPECVNWYNKLVEALKRSPKPDAFSDRARIISSKKRRSDMAVALAGAIVVMLASWSRQIVEGAWLVLSCFIGRYLDLLKMVWTILNMFSNRHLMLIHHGRK